MFREMDDLTLGRWMAQTLGQFHGRVLRLSHPLVNTYRLAAQFGHQREIWIQRVAPMPSQYHPASCCRAPFVPIVSRDILESGLICLHCSGTALPLDDLDLAVGGPVTSWAKDYQPVHAVAHLEDQQRRSQVHYDKKLENAALQAEMLLAQLRKEILPDWLTHFPTVVWEDQDECLDVLPEDIDA
jgi:hypothetical protein